MRIDLPMISSAVYPNIRSAALFQVWTMPSICCSGYAITVEPGIYFIPALLNDAENRAKHRDAVAWDRVELTNTFDEKAAITFMQQWQDQANPEQSVCV